MIQAAKFLSSALGIGLLVSFGSALPGLAQTSPAQQTQGAEANKALILDRMNVTADFLQTQARRAQALSTAITSGNLAHANNLLSKSSSTDPGLALLAQPRANVDSATPIRPLTSNGDRLQAATRLRNAAATISDYSVFLRRLHSDVEAAPTQQVTPTLRGSSIPRAVQIMIDPIGDINLNPHGTGGSAFAAPYTISTNAAADSFPFIMGGGATISYPATVAVLYQDLGIGPTTHCTGTLIAPNAVITAAHCSSGEYGYPVKVALQHVGVYDVDASKTAIFDKYNFPYGDISLLFLTQDVTDVQPAALNEAGRLAPGSPGRIVGFGYHRGVTAVAGAAPASPQSAIQPAGIKLHANVTTGPCPSGSEASLICWTYVQGPAAALKGSTCYGDSGGPLFRQVNGQYYLAGVTSGGVTCDPGDKAFDTEVYDFLPWIKGKLAGYPSAKAPPHLAYVPLSPVMGADWQDLSPQSVFDFQLGSADGTFSTALDVPANLAILRVEVNTVPGDGSKLRLEVGKTGDPSTCIQEDQTTVLVCEFVTPQSGSWHAKISGRPNQEFQAVVTQFPAK